MNAYLDLMVISHIIITMVSINFMQIVDCYRLKWRGFIKLILCNFIQIFFIYLKWYLGFILFFLLNGIIFFLFYKKKFLRPYLEFISCYLFLSLSLSFFSKELNFKNGILVICKPSAILYILFAPLFNIILILVSKGIDTIYRLGNYKTDAIISVDGKKAKFKCYFDTGNTLKCDGIPVIFCLKRTWPFSFINTTNKVNVNTVNGSSEMELTKALITFDDKRTSIVVYVALLDQDESFNGCECLLNAYLG